MSNATGRVAGKVAVVAGGASGIGKAAAHVLAQHGATTIVADLDEAGASKVAQELNDLGFKAAARKLDVTSEPQWQDILAGAVKDFGRLDVMVNSAGISSGSALTDLTVEHWQQVMKVNVEGCFIGTKTAVRTMRMCSSKGSIINISSVLGIRVSPGSAAYAACKAAIMMFSKSAAWEVAGEGIRVNTVAPGFVDTPIWDRGKFMQDLARQLGGRENLISMLAQKVPMRRMASTQEIATAILYLASDDSKYVTGTDLVIDGGILASP